MDSRFGPRGRTHCRDDTHAARRNAGAHDIDLHSRCPAGHDWNGLAGAGLLAGAWGKELFGRLRPYEVLQSGAWDATWFAGGSSFPSGHAAYYFGLFLPLVYLAPRQCRLLLVFPVFVAVSRVVENMHFLSDVVASVVLISLLTAGASRLVEREGEHGKAETGIPGPAG